MSLGDGSLKNRSFVSENGCLGGERGKAIIRLGRTWRLGKAKTRRRRRDNSTSAFGPVQAWQVKLGKSILPLSFR
jgi:hypothetical protein